MRARASYSICLIKHSKSWETCGGETAHLAHNEYNLVSMSQNHFFLPITVCVLLSALLSAPLSWIFIFIRTSSKCYMHCGTRLSENYSVREGFRNQCVTMMRNFLHCALRMQSCMVVLNPQYDFLHEIPGNPPLAPSPHLPGLGLLIKQFITFTASALRPVLNFVSTYPPPFMFSPCDLYDSQYS